MPYLKEYGSELVGAIREGTYKPNSFLRVEIPEANGKKRGLGISMIVDRVVYQGINLVLEAFYEFQFSETSYIRLVRGVFTQLRKFHTGVLLLDNITPRFCNAFLDYLQRNLNGNSPVNYFKKFKMCLSACVESGLILQNPASGIRLHQYNDVTKEILSEKELTQLALTPCRSPEVKRAFLFSCMSGLRWCDVKLLCYRNIDFAQKRITLIPKRWPAIPAVRYFT